MDLIIYHNDCPDGWCAAFVASKKYPEAKLFPRNHGLEPPYEEVAGRDVLVVDFSWRTREQNDKLHVMAKSFRILDHHKSAQEVLSGAPYATFDMKRSGAGLAWDFLFGLDSMGPYSEQYEERPWYVNYVEDRDLWTWNLTHSKEVNAYLTTLPHTKEAWSTLDQPGFDSSRAMRLGLGALAHVEHYVREAVKQAQVGNLGGHKTAVLNVPYLNCSEVGNELAKTHDISLTWFERGDGVTQFSLRGDGRVDVSKIAQAFGGGGHHNAAGFQLSLSDGRELLDKMLERKS